MGTRTCPNCGILMHTYDDVYWCESCQEWYLEDDLTDYDDDLFDDIGERYPRDSDYCDDDGDAFRLVCEQCNEAERQFYNRDGNIG